MVDVEQRGEVTQAELAAGLIDWKAFQDTYKDRWLECARRAFAELDSSGTGELGAEEIAGAFSSHLSPYEVRECSPRLSLNAPDNSVRQGACLSVCCLADGADGSDLLLYCSCLAWACAQVDAALHQALLEATGIVDDPAAAAAPGGEAGGGASAGAMALVAGSSSRRRLGTRISFEHFLGMLHDPSGVQDLEGFDDRWVVGGNDGRRQSGWCERAAAA